MTGKQWEIFCNFKKTYADKVAEWTSRVPNLQDLQKEAAKIAKTPDYSFETPVVYNRSLDELLPEDDIKLIVIGDNPGKEEQLTCNNRYLVGQAGRIADGFFKRNPELGINFRKNVIILNKTPVHSAKTAQLKNMIKLGGADMAALLDESQVWCAKETAKLHAELCEAGRAEGGVIPELWLVGYSELKKKGIFEKYRDELYRYYHEEKQDAWDKVFVFQHFSMNRFTIDLSDYSKKNGCDSLSLKEKISSLGLLHKEEIFN